MGSVMTISEYNEWYKELQKAMSFLNCIDHALEKCDDNTTMQFRVIGWSEDLKEFMCDAINCYARETRKAVNDSRPIIGLRIGDLIDVKQVCDEYGTPYLGSLFVGFGNDIKFASLERELDEYPVVLKFFGGNNKYIVIKTGWKST